MTVSSVAIYALMFATGSWIYGHLAATFALTALAAVAGISLVPILKRLNQHTH